MPSDYQTRERFLNETSTWFDTWNWTNPHTRWVTKTHDWESTTSRRNGWRSNDKRQSDLGGDFNHMKFEDQREPYFVQWHGGFQYGGSWAYNALGEFQCQSGALSEASIRSTLADISMSQPALQVVGTRFISEASPTAPKAGLTTALYELKHEGLPGISSKVVDGLSKTGPWKRRIKAPVKGTGSDYLNWQFGWLPVVSDVQALAKSVIEADSLLRSLYKDDGKVIRRRRGSSGFERVVDQSSSETSDAGWPTMVSPFYSSISGGKKFVSTETTRSQWFSGAFQYHLPESVTSLGKLRKVMSDARYLYGLGISPVDFWNLIPFSWLADWAVNAGDVLSNLSDQLYSRQVLRYGYVMARTTRTVYTHGTYPLSSGGMVAVPRAMQRYTVEQRIQATPFGFGLSWTGFTPYQLSILAALGISRGR